MCTGGRYGRRWPARCRRGRRTGRGPGRPVTVAAAFADEQPAMLPLPAEPFDPARLLQARVDGRARVCVRQNYYSVPAR